MKRISVVAVAVCLLASCGRGKVASDGATEPAESRSVVKDNAIPYELKGVRLGAHRDQVFEGMTADEYDIGQIDLDLKVSSFKKEDYSVAGADAEIAWFLVDNLLMMISVKFSQRDFASVRSAMIKKFGKPHDVEQSEVSNSLGATFPCEIVKWDNGTSTIRLVERSSKVNQSELEFIHLELLGLAESRKSKSNVDDL